jgi:dTDP-4-dehydrorhamnose reductase
MAEYRPHVVVNGQELVSDDPKSFVSNSKDPVLFAMYARGVGARYMHLSDSSVFTKAGATDEDEPYPTSVYGVARLIGERTIMNVHPKAAIVRVPWVYGYDVPESPPMIAWSQTMGERKVAHVYDDIMVSPAYIADVTERLLRSIVVGPFPSGVVHMAPAVSTTWYQFLKGEYPHIVPMKGGSKRISLAPSRRASLVPSEGWELPDGFGRHLEEIRGKQIEHNAKIAEAGQRT